MAIDRTAPLTAPLWSGRMVEWGILAVLVLVLVSVFGRQVRVVQGQGELAAVQSTLGALRTAFVTEHLQQTLHSTRPSVAAEQRNPFMLLKQLPANYAGEISKVNFDAAAPGRWAFDPACGCIGYLPLHPEWLESPANMTVVWFRISAPPGPLSITALHTYVWQGQVVN